MKFGPLVILGLIAPAAGADYVQEFKALTKMEDGRDFCLVPPDADCLDGTVRIQEAGGRAVYISIGEHPFMDAVGPDSNQRFPDDSENCTYTRDSAPLVANVIELHKVITCKKSGIKSDRYYRIDVKPNGFVTTETNHGHKQVCVYEKRAEGCPP